MANFQKVKLGDIFKLEYGKGLVAEKRISGDFPVYGSSGCVGVHNEYLVEGPGIIVGRKGSVGEVYFSKNNFYPIDTAYYIPKNDTKYNIRFLYYFLKNLNLKRLQGDTGVPGLNRDTAHGEVVEFSFDVPTQTRIASVLSAYDDLIENNEKRIKALEEMAQLLYTEWFVKFKLPGHEKVKMVDSGTEYGMIPEGWEVGKISELANVVSGFPFKGSTYQEGGKYKIVTIKNVHDGKFVLNFDSFIDELPAKLPETCILKSGDILLSLTGNVGRICVVYGQDHVLNQRVAKLDPINTNKREYIYLLFRQKRFQQKLEAMSNGAAQQNLSPIQVKDIKVVIPKSEILDEFSRLVGKYFDLSLSLQEENQNLSKIRDLLIPHLVTGRREF